MCFAFFAISTAVNAGLWLALTLQLLAGPILFAASRPFRRSDGGGIGVHFGRLFPRDRRK
jgi:hypothetical protein